MAIAREFAPFVPFCFLACYVAFLLAKPSRIEWVLLTLLGSAAGWAMAVANMGLANMGLANLGPWIAGLGLAAAGWALLAPLVHRKTAPPVIVLLALYPWIASTAVLLTNSAGGMVLDRYLLAADGSFGFQAGFHAAAFLLRQPAIRHICELCYFGLPVAVASLLHTASARRLMIVCGLLAVSAVAGYAMFPAVGSQIAFADRFPENPPATNAATAGPMFQPGEFPRNFMPSLHTAWGLALLLAAWPLGAVWRGGIVIYLIPMLFYALASHYLCDLIVAVPWTLAIWSALDRNWRHSALYAAGAAAWMLLIRFGLGVLYSSIAVPWALAAATLAWPFVWTVERARQNLPAAEPRLDA